MLSTPAFLLSLLPCVATADWDFLRSGAGVESGMNVEVPATVKAAVLIAASSFGLLLTGIVQGGILIPLLVRRRRLFQIVPLAAFHRGFSAPWEGFGFLCRYPRLWWFGVVPVVLNLIVTGAAVMLFLVAAIGCFLYLHPLFPEGWFWGVIEFFCVTGLVVLAGGLGLVLYVFLQGSLIGYYLAKLAREVELQLGLPPSRITEVSMSIGRFSCLPAPGCPRARLHHREQEGQCMLVSRHR